MRWIVRPPAVALAAWATLALCGCGPGRGDVSGKVTYRGKPLVFGSVQFVGGDSRPRLAEIGLDGTYRATGVAAGGNKVLVSSPDPTMFVRLSKDGRPLEPPPVDPKRWFPIPNKYGDPHQSDLTLTVRANADNPFDIDLQ